MDFRTLVLSVSLCTLLAACGGGGSSSASTTSGASSPATGAAAATITSFAPTTVLAGQSVTVTGTQMDAVTVLTVGVTAVPISSRTPTTLTFTVPAGLSGGLIAVQGAGFNAQSSMALAVDATPQALSLSRPSAPTSSQVTLNGMGLGDVTSISVAGAPCPIVSASASAITFTLPSAPLDGSIVLQLGGGVSFSTPLSLATYTPLSVLSMSPTSAMQGSTITVSGTGLEAVTSVQLGGGVVVVPSAQGPASLTFVVPALAVGGPVVFVTPFQSVTSSFALNIALPFAVTSFVLTETATGSAIVLGGTGLGRVTALTVGSQTVAFSSPSDAEVDATLTPSQTGAVSVTVDGTARPVGTVGAYAGGTARLSIDRVDFAQVREQPTGGAYQLLVAGHDTLVRAFVHGLAAVQAVPKVAFTVSAGGKVLGTIPAIAPATLPVSTAAGSLGTLAASFHATLPARWIVQNMTVTAQVEPAPAGTSDSALALTVAPAVGAAIALQLVIVPLDVYGNLPAIPAVADMKAIVTRQYPYPADAITVTVRAPYVVPSNQLSGNTVKNINAVLGLLESLRIADGAIDKEYVGFCPTNGPADFCGNFGLGVSTEGSATSASLSQFSAIVKDPAAFWPSTLTHEMGHNHGRFHIAACGGAGPYDASIPAAYASGVLGAAPFFDAASGDDATGFSLPPNQYDTMCYAPPPGGNVYQQESFSDYNQFRVQQFAINRAALVAKASAQRLSVRMQAARAGQSASDASESQSRLVVSGRLTGDGRVIFSPATVVDASVTGTNYLGEYLLRAVTANGTTIDTPFEPAATPGDGVASQRDRTFSVELRHITDVRSMSVVFRGVTLPEAVASGDAAATTTTATAQGTVADVLRWVERDGRLEVRWDASRQPSLTLIHVSVDGRRQVLALQDGSGSVVVDTSALPRGGQWWFVLADKYAARRVTAAR